MIGYFMVEALQKKLFHTENWARIVAFFENEDKDHELKYYPDKNPYLGALNANLQDVEIANYLNSTYFLHYNAIVYVHAHPELYQLSFKEAKRKPHAELYKALSFEDAVKLVYQKLVKEYKKAKNNRAGSFYKEVKETVQNNPTLANHLTALAVRRTHRFVELEDKYKTCKQSHDPCYELYIEQEKNYKEAWKKRKMVTQLAVAQATFPATDPIVVLTNTWKEINDYQLSQARRAICLPFTDSVQESAWNQLKREHQKVAQNDSNIDLASELALIETEKKLLTKNGYFSEAKNAQDFIDYTRYIQEALFFNQGLRNDIKNCLVHHPHKGHLTELMHDKLFPFLNDAFDQTHSFNVVGWAAWQSHTYIEEGKVTHMGRILAMQILAYLSDIYINKKEGVVNDPFNHLFDIFDTGQMKGLPNVIRDLNETEDYAFNLSFLIDRPKRNKPSFLELQALLRFVRVYLPKDQETQSIFMTILNNIYYKDREAFQEITFIKKIDPQLLAVHTANSAEIVDPINDKQSRSFEAQRKAKVIDTTFGDEEPGYEPQYYKTRFLSPLLKVFSILKFWKWPGWIKSILSDDDDIVEEEPIPAPRTPQLSKVEGFTSASKLNKAWDNAKKGKGDLPTYKILPHCVSPYRKKRFILFKPLDFYQDGEYEYIGVKDILINVKHKIGNWCYAVRGLPYYERRRSVPLELTTIIPKAIKGNLITGKVSATKPSWWYGWLGGKEIWNFFQNAEQVDTAAVIWGAYLHLKKSLKLSVASYKLNDEDKLAVLDQHFDFITIFDFVTLIKQTQQELLRERNKLSFFAVRAKLYFRNYNKVLNSLLNDKELLQKIMIMAEYIVNEMDTALEEQEELQAGIKRYKVSTQTFERYIAFFDLIEKDYLVGTQSFLIADKETKKIINKFNKIKKDFNEKRNVVYWIEHIVKNKKHWLNKYALQLQYNYDENCLPALFQQIELYMPDHNKPAARALVNFLNGTYLPSSDEDYQEFLLTLNNLFKENPKANSLSNKEKAKRDEFFKLIAQNFILPHINTDIQSQLEPNSWILNKYAYRFVKTCFEKEKNELIDSWRLKRSHLVYQRFEKINQFLNSEQVLNVTHFYLDKNYEEQYKAFLKDIKFIERYGEENNCLTQLKLYLWSDLKFANHYGVTKGPLYAAMQNVLQPYARQFNEEVIREHIEKNEHDKKTCYELIRLLESNQSEFANQSQKNFESAIARIIKFTHGLCETNEIAKATFEQWLILLEKFNQEQVLTEEEEEMIISFGLIYSNDESNNIKKIYDSLIQEKEILLNKRDQLNDLKCKENFSKGKEEALELKIHSYQSKQQKYYQLFAEEILIETLMRYFQLPAASLSLEAAYGACRFDYYIENKEANILNITEINFFQEQQDNLLLHSIVQKKLDEISIESDFNPQWLYAAPIVGALKNESLIDTFNLLIEKLDFSTLYNNNAQPLPILEKILQTVLDSNNQSIIAYFGIQWASFLVSHQIKQLEENNCAVEEPLLLGNGRRLAKFFFTQVKDNANLIEKMIGLCDETYHKLVNFEEDYNYYIHNNHYKKGALVSLCLWTEGASKGKYASKVVTTLLNRYQRARSQQETVKDLYITDKGQLHMAKRYQLAMTNSPQSLIQPAIDEAFIVFMNENPAFLINAMDFFFLLVHEYGGNEAQLNYHLVMIQIMWEKDKKTAERLFAMYQGLIKVIGRDKENVFTALEMVLTNENKALVVALGTQLINKLKVNNGGMESLHWYGVKEAMIKFLLPQNEQTLSSFQRLYCAWFYAVAYENISNFLSSWDKTYYMNNVKALNLETSLGKLIGKDLQTEHNFLQQIIFYLRKDSLIFNQEIYIFLENIAKDIFWHDKQNEINQYRELLSMRQLERKLIVALDDLDFTSVTRLLKELVSNNKKLIYKKSLFRINEYILQRYRELNTAFTGLREDLSIATLEDFTKAIVNTECPQITKKIEQEIANINKETQAEAGNIKKVRNLVEQLRLAQSYYHIEKLRTDYMPGTEEHDNEEIDTERWMRKRQILSNYITSIEYLNDNHKKEMLALTQGAIPIEGGKSKSPYEYPREGSDLAVLKTVDSQQAAEAKVIRYIHHNENAYVNLIQEILIPSLKNYLPQWNKIEFTTDNARACAKYLASGERTQLLKEIEQATQFLAPIDPLSDILTSFVTMVVLEVKINREQKSSLTAQEERDHKKAARILLNYTDSTNTEKNKDNYWDNEVINLMKSWQASCSLFLTENKEDAINKFFSDKKDNYLLRLLESADNIENSKEVFSLTEQAIEKSIQWLIFNETNLADKYTMVDETKALIYFYERLSLLPALVNSKKDFGEEEIQLEQGPSQTRNKLLMLCIKNIIEFSAANYQETHGSILFNLYHLIKLISFEKSNKVDKLLLNLFNRYIQSIDSNVLEVKNDLRIMEALLSAVWPEKIKVVNDIMKDIKFNLSKETIDTKCQLLKDQGCSGEEITIFENNLKSKLPDQIQSQFFNKMGGQGFSKKNGIMSSVKQCNSTITTLKDKLFSSLVTALNIPANINVNGKLSTRNYHKEIKGGLYKILISFEEHNGLNSMTYNEFEGEIKTCLMTHYLCASTTANAKSFKISPAILKMMGIQDIKHPNAEQIYGSWINEKEYGTKALFTFLFMLYEIDKESKMICREKNPAKIKQHMQCMVLKVLSLAYALNYATLRNNYYAQRDQLNFLGIKKSQPEIKTYHLFFFHCYYNLKDFLADNKNYFENFNLELKDSIDDAFGLLESDSDNYKRYKILTLSKNKLACLEQSVAKLIDEEDLEPGITIEEVREGIQQFNDNKLSDEYLPNINEDFQEEIINGLVNPFVSP